MHSRTSTVLSTLHAVQDFMTANANALGTLNDSASRRDLDEVESTLSGLAVAQARSKNGSRSAVTRKRVVKNTLLVKYLRPISAISQAKLKQSADFAELRLPLPAVTRTMPQLVSVAEAMGQAASRHAEVFIAAGMAPTFVADLASAVNDVRAAVTSQGATRSSQLGASKALETTAQQAVKIVRQLDALIEPLLAGNTALLVKWKATKRFSGRTPGVSVAASDSAQSPSALPAGDSATADALEVSAPQAAPMLAAPVQGGDASA